MKPPRGLTAEETAAWARLASTVKPLRIVTKDRPKLAAVAEVSSPVKPVPKPRGRVAPARPAQSTSVAAKPAGHTLDSTWDRKLIRGTLKPDFTLDLHGHTLDRAYTRLMDGLTQAREMGARVVLVIAGKPRPVEAADRAGARGAIRAKVLDWLAASSHRDSIAAIRNAHIRHGGDGALYVVLRRSS